LLETVVPQVVFVNLVDEHALQILCMDELRHELKCFDLVFLEDTVENVDQVVHTLTVSHVGIYFATNSKENLLHCCHLVFGKRKLFSWILLERPLGSL